MSEARARLRGARAAESAARTAPEQISISPAQDKAAAARILQAKAQIRRCFWLLGVGTLAVIPLLFIMRRPPKGHAPAPSAH